MYRKLRHIDSDNGCKSLRDLFFCPVPFSFNPDLFHKKNNYKKHKQVCANKKAKYCFHNGLNVFMLMGGIGLLCMGLAIEVIT